MRDGFFSVEPFPQGSRADFLFLHHGRNYSDGFDWVSFHHAFPTYPPATTAANPIPILINVYRINAP